MVTLGISGYNQSISDPGLGITSAFTTMNLKQECFSDSEESSHESWPSHYSSEQLSENSSKTSPVIFSDNSTKTSPPASESGFVGCEAAADFSRFDGIYAANSAKYSIMHSLRDSLQTRRDNLMFDDLGHIFHPLNSSIARECDPIRRGKHGRSPRVSPRSSVSPRISPRISPRMSPRLSPRMSPRSMNRQMDNHRGRSRRNHGGIDHLTVPRGGNMSRSISRSPVGGRKIPEHRICKFFSNGYCNRGSGCNWAHVNIVPTRGCGNRNEPDGYQNGGHPNVNLANLKGNVYLLARQQEGCRMLQRYLEQENNAEAIDIIWREAIQHVGPLITDPFGHYLWLRLLDRITPTQRLELLKNLSSDMVGISLNVHGTRVVQKLLEKVKGKDEIEAAISALKGEISTLSKDVYGMHVVLRCLYHQGIDNAFIINAVAKRIVSVSMHKHGCCVVQWCLDYGTRAQREGLIDQIAKNALELVQDAYGNYVVQQIMDVSKWKSHEDAASRRKVMNALLGNIAKLAVQKFSSIVVEKCLQEADDDIRRAMVEELVDPARLPRLLQDPYANYVIQKVLSVSRSDEFQRLIVRIRPHLDVLSATPFGKRIQLQMFRKFPILSINGSRQHVKEMGMAEQDIFLTRALNFQAGLRSSFTIM